MGPRKQSSQFKGVATTKPDKRGNYKFRVQYWNGKLKKNIQLGVYDNEFEAAAVYQEHIGNKEEAARLRGLVDEHKALNPDRPGQKKRKKKNEPPLSKMPQVRLSGAKIWVCKRCGLEYRTDPSANGCPGCSGTNFREIEQE